MPDTDVEQLSIDTIRTLSMDAVQRASTLQYCALHLTGYGLPLVELERFRQWRSATPGPTALLEQVA